jgi:uncharacterized membrane protein
MLLLEVLAPEYACRSDSPRSATAIECLTFSGSARLCGSAGRWGRALGGAWAGARSGRLGAPRGRSWGQAAGSGERGDVAHPVGSELGAYLLDDAVALDAGELLG